MSGKSKRKQTELLPWQSPDRHIVCDLAISRNRLDKVCERCKGLPTKVKPSHKPRHRHRWDRCWGCVFSNKCKRHPDNAVNRYCFGCGKERP